MSKMNNKKKPVKKGGDPRPEGYVSVPSKDYKEKADLLSDRTSGLKPAKKKAGGYMKKNYASGGKLKMVEKDGEMVPFYAADGKGKMMAGGKVKKYAKGGKIGRGCGAALRGGGKVMKY